MNILEITGSPHKHGCSNYLMEQFTAGAKKAGHEITRVDAAFVNVHPCIGCDHCESGLHPCIYKDDMVEIYEKLKAADAVVYSTPLYYHAPSAQLMALIDRYHGIDNLIRNTGKRSVLLVTGGNPDPTFMDGIKQWYATTLRYLGWEKAGELYVHGCTTPENLENTESARKAYELGLTIGEK